MYLTAITHASARDKEYHFRGLTPTGQEESTSAAWQVEAVAKDRSLPAFDNVVSSPKPRCLETVILFAKALGNDSIEASSVTIDPGLAAGNIEGGELAALAVQSDAAHLLISGHADLAKTLPTGVSLATGAAEGGWFTVRPVLFQVEIQTGQRWDEATVHFCTALVDGHWQNLLAT